MGPPPLLPLVAEVWHRAAIKPANPGFVNLSDSPSLSLSCLSFIFYYLMKVPPTSSSPFKTSSSPCRRLPSSLSFLRCVDLSPGAALWPDLCDSCAAPSVHHISTSLTSRSLFSHQTSEVRPSLYPSSLSHIIHPSLRRLFPLKSRCA